VESFADRRPDRIVWKDRQWEWAALRFEDGDFNAPNYADTYARVVSLDSVDEIRTTRACSLSTPDARDTIHLRIALWNAPSAPVVRGRRPAVRASKSEIPSRDAGPGSRECDSRSLSAVRALDRPSSGSPVTPAMAAGMMDSVWTMEALLAGPARPVSDQRHCVALSSTLSRDTTNVSKRLWSRYAYSVLSIHNA